MEFGFDQALILAQMSFEVILNVKVEDFSSSFRLDWMGSHDPDPLPGHVAFHLKHDVNFCQ